MQLNTFTFFIYDTPLYVTMAETENTSLALASVGYRDLIWMFICNGLISLESADMESRKKNVER